MEKDKNEPYEKGKAFYGDRKFIEAIQCFDEVIKADPKNIKAWSNKGYALNNLGKYDEALQCFDEAIKLDSKYKEAWNGKGISFHNLGKYSEAIQCYDEAIKLDSRYKKALLNKGVSFASSKRFDKAIELYDEALTLDSKDKSALVNKAISLYKLRKYDKAIQCFEKIIKLNPNKEAWFYKGKSLYAIEKYDEAIQCFDETIKLDSNYKQAWYNKGISFDDLGKYNEAIECFDEAIKLDSNYKKAWFNKGLSLYDLEKFPEAIQCYDKVIELDPKYKQVWNNKGKSLHSLKRYNEAIECFDEAIKLDSNYSHPWNGKGDSLKDLEQFSEAIQCFDKAIDLDSKYKQAWNNKGKSLHSLKRYDEAIECFDEAIKLDSNYKQAWYNKGMSLYNLTNFKEAIECFDETIKLDSKYKEAWLNKGISFDELSKYNKAIQCFNEAIELDSQYKEALFNKGISLNNLGEYNEAIECFDKAIELDSKYKQAWNNKGKPLHSLKRYNEAIQCFDEAIKLDSNYKQAWYNKGKSLHSLKRYDEAIQCFDEAIKLDKKYEQAWFNRGVSLDRLQRYKEALECYDTVLKLDSVNKEALFNKGNVLNNLGKYNEAIESYSEAILFDSKNKEALNNKGISLNNIGNYDEAIRFFKKATKLDSNYKEALHNEGVSLNNLGKYSEALRCFNKVIDSNYLNEEVLNNKGISLAGLGKYNEAIQCFDEAIKLDSKFKEAWNNKGLALNNLGKYNEAIECFDEAIKLDSKYKEAWYNKGISFDGLGKYSEAIQCFDEAIKLDSDYKNSWNRKGVSFHKQMKYSEALQCYDEAIKIDKKYKEAWNNKGEVFNNLKKYNEAIECFDKATKIDSKYKEALLNKGTSLHFLKNYDEAIECYDEAIDLDSKYKQAWNNKGKSLHSLKRYDEAIQCFDEAIKLDSNYKEAWNNKGMSLYNLTNFNEAIECYDKAIKLDLKYKKVWNNKGKSLHSLKRYDEAIQCFDEAIKLDSDYKAAWNNQGISFDELGKYDEAIQCYDKAIKLDRKSKKFWNNKGVSLNNLERYNEAIQCFDEAIKLDSKHAYALNNKAMALYNLGKYKEAIQCCDEAIKLDYKHFCPWRYKGNSLIKLGKLENGLKCLNRSIRIKGRYKEGLNDIGRLHLKKGDFNNALKFFDESLKLDANYQEAKINKERINKIQTATSSNLYFKNSLEEIKANKINKLDLGVFNLGNNDCKTLSESLKINYSLIELNLEYNDIGNEGINYLNDALNINNSLQILNLKYNLFDDLNTLNRLENKLEKNKKFTYFIQSSNIVDWNQTILKMKDLKILIIKACNLKEIPKEINELNELVILDLQKNQLSEMPDLQNLNQLTTLDLSKNKINLELTLQIPKSTKILILNENNIEIIPKKIQHLKQLKRIYLNKNQIKSIPTEIKELTELIELQIRDNLIKEIPSIIGELVNLESIDISNNQISFLPPSMFYLNKLNELNFKGNPITNPPIQFTNTLKDLRGYWKDLLIGQQKCNYQKLIILGEENVGKTTLIRTLLGYNNPSLFNKLFPNWSIEKEFNNKPLSTDGIDISVHPLVLNADKTYTLPNNQLILNIWDFGGQEVYYSTHIFFLSPNSIYLIVWNMNKKESDELERVLYWIQTLNSYIKDPMIILVGTHLDEIQNTPNFKTEAFYENISTRTGISKAFIIGVSCKNGLNYNILIKKLKELSFTEEGKLPAKKSKSMVGEIFPKIYSDLKEIIEKEGKNRMENNLPPILEWKEFESITKNINIVGEELKRGVSFLHYLGFCLYFSNDEALNKYIVLNPQWLAKTMATIVTTKGNFAQKGLINHQHFKHVWKDPDYPSTIHKILFELLQKFQVLIPITHDIEGNIYLGRSVVPALLSNEIKVENVTTKWNQGGKISVQRIYEFNSFLPSQIFPQFIATIFALFGVKNVQYWRDGILVKKEKIKCLIELDLSNKLIVISFAGNKFISLFKQIQLRLEMVLKKWENLNLEIYVTCPTCSLYPDSIRNKCFKLKDCFNNLGTQPTMKCDYSSKSKRDSEFQIVELIPELDLSQIKKIIEWSEIGIEDKIGEGSFAEVYKGKYEDNFVAVKRLKLENNLPILDISASNTSSFSNADSVREFLLEIGFLSFGQHPNLLQFIGIVLSPPSIVLPFATYGSLFKFIHKETNINYSNNEDIKYSYELMLRIGLDIILGLNYLHSLTPSIIHCDLKSENILIMNADYKNPDCVCKISDFGLSQFYVGRFLVNKNVNPRWAAPEVLEGKDQTVQSDIYSFGIILYELLTKQIPYSPQQNPNWNFMQNVRKSILEEIKPTYSKETIKKEFKISISNDIYKLMESCWDSIPKNRPTSESIIKLFYSLLSNYWNEIENIIKLPLSSKKTINEFIELKNEALLEKTNLLSSKGSYGIVSLCKSKELSEEKLYVIKEMKSKGIPESKKLKVLNSFEIELEILKNLNSPTPHPNIVQLIGYYKNLNEENKKFWLILEYCNGGSLEQNLREKSKRNETFSLEELKKLFKDILVGLKYLHDNGYAHLDLKTDNILIKKENDNILNLCLCDFGTGKVQSDFDFGNEEIGTYAFMAPEVVKMQENKNKGGYDEMKSDIWSLGLVLFRMLGEEFPGQGPFTKALLFSSTFDINSHQPFYNIYLDCTQLEPLDRPSVNEILEIILEEEI